MPASPASSDDLPRLLARAWFHFQPHLLRHLAEEQLDGRVHPGSGPLLFSLLAKDGQRVSDLATSTGLSHVATIQTIARLERSGLVARRDCDEDDRATRVWLTRAGRAVEPRLRAVHRKNLALLIRALGSADAARLASLLRTLVAFTGDPTPSSRRRATRAH
jgi:DNA-binding MarR family transcriptional regulator